MPPGEKYVVGVPNEIKTHESRVALTTVGVEELTRGGNKVLIQSGAGQGSGISDEQYRKHGAEIVNKPDDVWDNADGFQFVYQPLHGGGSIVARVASISDGNPWEKCGVMIREKASPDARHAFMAITRDSGAAFQRRLTPGSASDHTPGPAIHAPVWVKLVRAGNIFTGYVSTDHREWQKVGDATIDMPRDVLIGLAVCAHDNGALCNAVFDDVAVRPADR